MLTLPNRVHFHMHAYMHANSMIQINVIGILLNMLLSHLKLKPLQALGVSVELLPIYSGSVTFTTENTCTAWITAPPGSLPGQS